MKQTLWISRRMFYRVLRPSFISAMALAVADIADALVVGLKAGEKGLAAIGIVTPVYMLYNLIGYGFSTGGCVTHGKLTAAARNDAALCHFRTLAKWLLAASFLIAAAGNLLMRPFLSLLGVNGSRPELLSLCETYARPLIGAAPVFMLNFILYDFVRCDDGPGLAALGFSLGCAVDFGLNILLVLFLDMGVAGSIIATVTAQTVSVAVLMVHLFKGEGILRLKDILRARGNRTEIRPLAQKSLTIGFSASVRYVFQFVFLFLANRLLLHAGDQGILNGDLYVAVFDVVINVSYLALALYQASAETMQPLASAFSEEHDDSSLNYVLRLALFWGVGSGIVLAGLLSVFSGTVSSFFGLAEAASMAVSVPAIRIFCLSTPFAGALIILTAFYQSTGQARLSSLVTILRSAAVLLPVTVFFGLFFPSGFWWLFPVCETASFLTALAVHSVVSRRRKTDSIPVFTDVMDHANHELNNLLTRLEAFCDQQQIPAKKAMQIQLAVEELCLVTMEQAFTGQPDEYIQVTLALEADDNYTLCIRNSAPRFNPLMMQMGRLQRDREEELLASVGVLMVKKQSKSLSYRNYEGFNVLRVVL